MTFEELWNSQQYTDDPDDKVFAEHFYFQGRKSFSDLVTAQRKELFDNAQQLLLKDQKIDHITFIGEEADREIQQLRTIVAEQQKRIAELEASPTIATCREMIEHAAVKEASHLHTQLAASQAQIKVLRDRLGEIAWSNNSEWQSDAAKEALSQPTDDSALRELLKAEREGCAKVCDEMEDKWRGWSLREAAAKIRAMEDQ